MPAVQRVGDVWTEFWASESGQVLGNEKSVQSLGHSKSGFVAPVWYGAGVVDW